MLFRSLAYFRDCENAVRGDEYECTPRFLPDGGLQITNQMQGTQFTLAGYAFESTVKANEIFVFCTLEPDRSPGMTHWYSPRMTLS
jgi:hypothetical protein